MKTPQPYVQYLSGDAQPRDFARLLERVRESEHPLVASDAVFPLLPFAFPDEDPKGAAALQGNARQPGPPFRVASLPEVMSGWTKLRPAMLLAVTMDCDDNTAAEIADFIWLAVRAQRASENSLWRTRPRMAAVAGPGPEGSRPWLASAATDAISRALDGSLDTNERLQAAFEAGQYSREVESKLLHEKDAQRGLSTVRGGVEGAAKVNPGKTAKKDAGMLVVKAAADKIDPHGTMRPGKLKDAVYRVPAVAALGIEKKTVGHYLNKLKKPARTPPV